MPEKREVDQTGKLCMCCALNARIADSGQDTPGGFNFISTEEELAYRLGDFHLPQYNPDPALHSPSFASYRLIDVSLVCMIPLQTAK
jgi:hypothetical protein